MLHTIPSVLIILSANLLLATEYPSLVARSPFCAACEHTIMDEVDTDHGDKFELHGIFIIDDKYVFSVHNLSTNKNFLAAIGEQQPGFVIKKYRQKKT